MRIAQFVCLLLSRLSNVFVGFGFRLEVVGVGGLVHLYLQWLKMEVHPREVSYPKP